MFKKILACKVVIFGHNAWDEELVDQEVVKLLENWGYEPRVEQILSIPPAGWLAVALGGQATCRPFYRIAVR